MAITPAQAAKLTENELMEVSRLELRIDTFLTGQDFDYAGRIILGKPEGSKRVLDEVIERYRGAGWNIVEHIDQRDGDFWAFEVQ